MSSILTVSQINTYISFKIKNDPKLKGIAVKGEISNLSINQKSGHIYFTLKDAASAIKCVMFNSSASRLRFLPSDGQGVVVFGNIDVYERDGVYQILVNEMLPVGDGAAYLALAMLKEELEKAGIFSSLKKEINRFPNKIAVVTSSSGAALQDILNILSRRYPLVKVSVYSTLVQGIYAPASIVKSLIAADKSGADTIILARGGGSSEDLAAFNTKEVAMAVYNCNTPVISAVGHETDWSFADLASDLRAPTPSGAAELACVDINDVVNEINLLTSNIQSMMKSRLRYNSGVLQSYKSILGALSPLNRIDAKLKEFSDLSQAINDYAKNKLSIASLSLNSFKNMLESLNPMNILERGYAAVTINDKLLTDISLLNEGDTATIVMKGGSFSAKVDKINKTEN